MIHALSFRARKGDVLGALAMTLDLVTVWLDRAAERRRLAGLDDHVLKDIGLSRADALGESSKPFWRA